MVQQQVDWWGTGIGCARRSGRQHPEKDKLSEEENEADLYYTKLCVCNHDTKKGACERMKVIFVIKYTKLVTKTALQKVETSNTSHSSLSLM